MRLTRMARGGVAALAVGATAVLAPLAVADPTVPVGASGSIDAPIPALPAAALTLVSGGQSYTLAVPAGPAGALAIHFTDNTAASVEVVVSDCVAPAHGTVITASGFAKDTVVTGTLAPQASVGDGSVGDGVVAADGTVIASLCSTAA